MDIFKKNYNIEENFFSRGSITSYQHGNNPAICCISYYLGRNVSVAILCESDSLNSYASLEAHNIASKAIDYSNAKCHLLFLGVLSDREFAEGLEKLSSSVTFFDGFDSQKYEPATLSYLAYNHESAEMFFYIGPDYLTDGLSKHGLVIANRRNSRMDFTTAFNNKPCYETLQMSEDDNILLANSIVLDLIHDGEGFKFPFAHRLSNPNLDFLDSFIGLNDIEDTGFISWVTGKNYECEDEE